jgi:enoyl-CoA hydratase
MEFNHLKLEIAANGVATLILNRPTKYNALTIETISELGKAFVHIYDNPAIKVVILTGEGEKAFAAGADITEIANLKETSARKFVERGQEAFQRIESCPKPIIAVVNGFALGGGCELAMACHIRIATANAKFGLPEVNLGLIPGYGGTQRLTLLVGKGRALELMLTGDSIGADEAYRLGLVNHVSTDKEAALAKANQLATSMMTKAPIALGLVIDCANAAHLAEDGYQAEANAFASACKTEDFREGTAAFLEKRTPVFKGK